LDGILEFLLSKSGVGTSSITFCLMLRLDFFGFPAPI